MFIAGCSLQTNIQKDQIIGGWAYLEITDNSYLYTEMYIFNDSISFFDEHTHWTFPYNINDNFIRYLEKSMEIEVINDYTLRLKTDFTDVYAYRIVPVIESTTFMGFVNYHFRRIHFLVNTGYISIYEAEEMFCKKDLDRLENIQDEEIPIIKK